MLNARTEEIAWAISDDVRLALLFLNTISNPRAPWLDQYERWADGRALAPDLRRMVRETIVKLRMRGR